MCIYFDYKDLLSEQEENISESDCENIRNQHTQRKLQSDHK